MLRELHISNLAVISDARIELASGLNCFTGATGAGKSLVIGALEVLLGLRNPSDMLRQSADEGRITGLFDLHDPSILKQLERITDLPLSNDGGELLIARRLYASGRTSASLNGNPITLSMLKQVAECLVDVHGQHDHQFLLKPSNQLQLLDDFAGLNALREQFHQTYLQLKQATQKLDELDAGRTLRHQQLELYRFQADEIDAAELNADEFAELKARSSLLLNLEKLKKDAGATHSALYAADGSVTERLKMIAAVLAELSLLDQNLQCVSTAVRDATMQLEDASFDLGRYLDKLDVDPSELAEVNDRLNTINRILNKYGDPIESTLAYRTEIGQKIDELSRATENQDELTATITPLTRELKKLGDDLARQRRKAADKLSPLIDKQLTELGMEKAIFTIDLLPTPDPQPTGFDTIEFIVQTNPGLAPQPLRKIASGGELSRIMLALKGILSEGDRVSVLVFDEIDANVGGRLGSVIGNKLRKLATRHQVLCITHLPQIASYADRHLTVRKESTGKETRTTVRPVDGDERLTELAEMIGGHRITPTTLAQAKELLESAQAEFKSKSATPTRKSKVSARG